MKLKHIWIACADLASTSPAAPVLAETTFTMDEVGVAVGEPEIAVDWNMGAAPDLLSISIDISFDPNLVVPVTSQDSNNIPGCIGNSDGAQLTSCRLLGAGDFIRLVLVSLSGGLGDANGTIIFSIDGDAAPGDMSDLSLAVENVVPTDFTVALANGSITIEPDAELTLAPNVFEFESQLVIEPPQQATFSVGNGAVVSSLQITSAFIGGGPFSVADNCVAEELAPGDECILTVTFDPDEVGEFTSALVVGSDGGTAAAILTGRAESVLLFGDRFETP